MSDKQRLLKLADNPVAKQDEEDLEDLLGDEEEEEEAPSLEEEVAEMRKSQAEQAKIMLSLTRSLSAVVKHVMAKDEDEEVVPEVTPEPAEDEDVMEKQEPAYGGTSDQGEPDVAEDTETDPALEGAAKERAEEDPGLVSLAKKGGKSKVSKDDASSNFGEKDSDVPGNPAVTPDTKDWPADQTVIPHSDLAPTLQKMQEEIKGLHKAMVAGGLIKKAQPRGVGVRTEEPQPDLQKLEERARGMSFQELNRMRAECGDLPRGIV